MDFTTPFPHNPLPQYAPSLRMNVNYISYSMLMICVLLAINIYRLRVNNTQVSESLTSAREELMVHEQNKAECETALNAQRSAIKEVKEALAAKIEENSSVQKNLEVCQNDLEKKKEELQREEEKRRQEEEKQREEDEKKKQEEDKQKEEKKIKETEEKKLEEEKVKQEEARLKEEEKQKHDEKENSNGSTTTEAEEVKQTDGEKIKLKGDEESDKNKEISAEPEAVKEE